MKRASLVGRLRALSEVDVSCVEKDPGFFAALRMTQKSVRASATSAVTPAPLLIFSDDHLFRSPNRFVHSLSSDVAINAI
jgi:hypothetical protein